LHPSGKPKLIFQYLGAGYIWGTVQVYAFSYFHSYNSDLTLSSMFPIFPILIACTTFLMYFGVWLSMKLPLHVQMVLGMTVTIGSVLISSFQTNFYVFLLFYGILQGIGAAMLYVLPVKTCWGYYPNRKGIVSGIIIGVFGLGSFTFNMISSKLINPDGVKPDEQNLVPKEVYD
jgi:hypothetical protein